MLFAHIFSMCTFRQSCSGAVTELLPKKVYRNVNSIRIDKHLVKNKVCETNAGLTKYQKETKKSYR